MGRPRGRHLSAYTKLGIQWLDPSSVAQQTARVATHALHAISLAQPPPTGRVAAVRVGTGVPYVMIEARLKADAFDDGIPKEGVIVYAVQTPDSLGHRVNKLRPVILKAPRALAVGESYSSDEVGVRVTAALPGGFSVEVEDRRAPLPSGGLASYGDAGTPGNVSNPVVVGFGGWQAFPHVFAGRDATGQDRIYAVVA